MEPRAGRGGGGERSVGVAVVQCEYKAAATPVVRGVAARGELAEGMGAAEVARRNRCGKRGTTSGWTPTPLTDSCGISGEGHLRQSSFGRATNFFGRAANSPTSSLFVAAIIMARGEWFMRRGPDAVKYSNLKPRFVGSFHVSAAEINTN